MISVQQSAFQVREHGIQGLNAAGGSIPDIGMLDEVNDPAVLVNIQLPDQLVLDHFTGAHHTLVGCAGGGAAVKDKHILGICRSASRGAQPQLSAYAIKGFCIQSRSMPMLIPW